MPTSSELPFPYSVEFLRYPYIDGLVDLSLTINPVEEARDDD